MSERPGRTGQDIAGNTYNLAQYEVKDQGNRYKQRSSGNNTANRNSYHYGDTDEYSYYKNPDGST
ncbi:hypothetical protein FRC02_004563, partial [Tulasnella sp. 418]